MQIFRRILDEPSGFLDERANLRVPWVASDSFSPAEDWCVVHGLGTDELRMLLATESVQDIVIRVLEEFHDGYGLIAVIIALSAESGDERLRECPGAYGAEHDGGFLRAAAHEEGHVAAVGMPLYGFGVWA